MMVTNPYQGWWWLMIKMMMGIQGGGPLGKQFATWKISLFHYNRYCKSANYVAIFHCQLGLPKGWPKRVDMIYPPIIKHGNRKSLINRILFMERSSCRVGNWTRRRCPFDVCGPIVVWRFAMDFMFFVKFASQFHWFHSPPARWGLLDFMSVASSSSSSFSSSSPLFSSPLLVSSPRLLSSCSLPDFNHDHPPPSVRLPDLNHDHPRPVFLAGPQPRPSPPCRTWTTTIHAQCSLPDLNHDHPLPSVPCRTSTASIQAKCSLPDLM